MQIDKKMYITSNSYLHNIWSVNNLQCLSFMYDLCYNDLQNPSLPLYFNNRHMLHSHHTRSSTNIYKHRVSSLDKRNFIYSGIITWNNCSNDIRSLPKRLFLHECKRNPGRDTGVV